MIPDTQPLHGTPLHHMWERSMHNLTSTSHQDPEPSQWTEETRMLYALGIGMEETMRFLYIERPSFGTFETWLRTHAKNNDTGAAAALEGDVLTTDDLASWEQNGYIVIRQAVSPEQCHAAQQAIWEYLGADPAQPDTWYTGHAEQRGMMLMFYHHPALEANRDAARIRRAYEQLYGHTNIYRTIDKVSFNPPENGQFTFKGSPLHWDVSLSLPIPMALQGLLYLNDVPAGAGAFHCVPGFHRELETWLGNLPEGTDPRHEAPRILQPVPVPGNAGDFIIWHQALPHCATPNHGKEPRLVQYLTYLPVDKEEQREWK
jgi:hypothetical protein